MSNLDDKKLTEEQLETQRLKLELEFMRKEELKKELILNETKKELERYELELEIKKLDLKLQDVARKETLVELKSFEQKKESILKQVKEIEEQEIVFKGSQNDAKKESVVVTAEKIDARAEYEKLLKSQRNKKIVYIAIGVALLIVYIFSSSIKGKANNEYYSSIPLVLNPEDFHKFTRQDVIDIYGEPPEDEIMGITTPYNRGDYTLDFGYNHGEISHITYIPDEPFFCKNSAYDMLYLFGLEDERNMFSYDEKDKAFHYTHVDANNDYVDSDLLSDIMFTWEDEKEKTVEEITLYFYAEESERPVFEDDFSDIPVQLDLMQYLYKSKGYIYNSFENIKVSELNQDIFIYSSELGEIMFDFDTDTQKVYRIELNSNEHVKYERSTQEAMIMFGVNPNYENLFLDDFDNYEKNGYEYYEDRNGKIGFRIIGINSVEKTFKRIIIWGL